MVTDAIVFDHRGRTKKGCEGPVEMRITVNRKPYYINLGIKIRGNELMDGKVIDRYDADELNQRIEILKKRILTAVNNCLKDNMPIDVSEIRRQAYCIKSKKADTAMYDWMVEQVPLLPVKDGTRERYQVLLSRLSEYGELMTWDDLTIQNIYQFDGWLHKLKAQQSNAAIQKGEKIEYISDATVYNYHRSFRALIGRALKFGIVSSNIYDRIRGEFRKKKYENVEYLTEEEIAAIESLHPMENTQMAMARDLFVFQIYTGLSYSDTQAFDIKDYKKVNGKWINVGQRVKTGVPYVSQLLPQAVEVIERYSMQAPKINCQQYNLALKTIQQALGISTRLHSHLARHTFATRALALGVSIENVASMLGHTNIKQTQRYAKVLAKSVHSDFDMMAEKMKK